ncbi:hypothetical protein D3C87_1661380 [compost metagenome]
MRLDATLHGELLAHLPAERERTLFGFSVGVHDPGEEAVAVLLNGRSRDRQRILLTLQAQPDVHIPARQQAVLRIGKFGA